MIILVNGPAHSGKDEVTKILRKRFKCRSIRFATPLKLVVHLLLGKIPCIDPDHVGAWDTEVESMGHMKDHKVWEQQDLRSLYIWMAESVIKPKFGPTFFAKWCLDQISRHYYLSSYASSQSKGLIIPDCGFTEELAYLEANSVHPILLIKVERPGYEFKGGITGIKDSRDNVDPVSTRVQTVIITNNGTLQDLENTVCKSLASNLQLKLTYQLLVQKVTELFKEAVGLSQKILHR